MRLRGNDNIKLVRATGAHIFRAKEELLSFKTPAGDIAEEN
jgi:hypothetical protein